MANIKSLPGGLGLEKCSRVLESRGFVTLSSLKHLRRAGRYRCVLPVPRKIVVGRETRLGKRNQGDDRPRKQNNIAMATGTFSIVIAILGRTIMLLLTKRRHEISHCRRTFYRQQQLPATLRSVQLLAVRRLNHWIERAMK